MTGDNDNDKKGFSGILDLTSDVNGLDEPVTPEPKPSAPKPFQQETASFEPERKDTNSPSTAETVSSGKNGNGSGGIWILVIIGVIFVVWLINNGGQSNKKTSYNPPSSSQSYNLPQGSPTTVTLIPIDELQCTKPSVGTNNVLSVAEISWCIREGIRIEAMRDVIDTNTGIDEFNRIVNDYNSRCESYRYREGSQTRAERDVEAHRIQIVSEAIRDARQLGSRSYPSASSGVSTSSAPKKPDAQYTKEAQQFLTDLGYDPGPVDGDYGRRTADAVKAFQRDAGITQDGWIDQDLLSTLKRVASQRSNLVSPRVKLVPAKETSKSIHLMKEYAVPPTSSTKAHVPFISDEAMERCVKIYNEATWLSEEIEETIVDRYSQNSVDNYNLKVNHYSEMISYFNINCAGKQSESANKAAKNLNKGL